MWGNGGGVAEGIAGPECGAGRRLRMENPASVTSEFTQTLIFVACGHFQVAAWKC